MSEVPTTASAAQRTPPSGNPEGAITERCAPTPTALVEELRRWAASPSADPFTPRVVVVPDRATGRYLAQSLALADPEGVCANVALPTVGGYTWDIVRRLGAELGHGESTDVPWQPLPLAWRIVDLLPRLTAPELQLPAPLRAVAGRPDPTRLAQAHVVAQLLAEYLEDRPDMLRAWSTGHDTDGAGGALAPGLRWQPQLWRLLAAERPDPVSVLDAWLARPTVLPADLAPTTGVAVFAPVGASPGAPTVGLTPFQRLALRAVAASTSVTIFTAAGGLRPAAGPALVHGCHGPLRQVEVLREQLLHLLHDDPTLEPRDCLVLCPDLPNFAPLIESVFDTGGPRAADGSSPSTATLPARLCLPPTLGANPVVEATGRLLRLVDRRARASEVIDFTSAPAVAGRLAPDAEELARLHDLIRASGARWGLDTEARTDAGVPARANTWAAAADRLALGVTLSQDALPIYGGTVPLDQIGSDDIDLVGGLVGLIDLIAEAQTSAATPRPVAEWAGLVEGWVERSMSLPPDQAWAFTAARALLTGVARAASPGDRAVHWREFVDAYEAACASASPRLWIGSGAVTFAPFDQLGAAPHRVICLLGLDDGSFPTATRRTGDDVRRHAPRPSDTDTVVADRRRFELALASATERAVVIFTGADPATDQGLPPAAPLAEAIATGAAVVPIQHPLHPTDAQNFQPGLLGTADVPFSHNIAALRAACRSVAGAVASASGTPDRRPRATTLPPLAEVRLPAEPLDGTRLSLDRCIAFWRAPATAFLRQGLGLPADAEPHNDDELQVATDALTKWQLTDGLVRALDRGDARAEAFAVSAQRSGDLPVGMAGRLILTQAMDAAHDLRETARAVRRGEPTTERFDVELRVGDLGLAVLRCSVGPVYEGHPVWITPSTSSPGHLLRYGLQVLALQVHRGAPVTGFAVFKDGLRQFSIAPGCDPAAVLAWFVHGWRLGLRRPLPAPPAVTLACVKKWTEVNPTDAQARAKVWAELSAKWSDSVSVDGLFTDDDQRNSHRIWGDAPFNTVLRQCPLDDWPTPPPVDGSLAGSTQIRDLPFDRLAHGVWSAFVIDSEE